VSTGSASGRPCRRCLSAAERRAPCRGRARVGASVRRPGTVDAEDDITRLAEHQLGLRVPSALGYHVAPLSTHQVQQLHSQSSSSSASHPHQSLHSITTFVSSPTSLMPPTFFALQTKSGSCFLVTTTIMCKPSRTASDSDQSKLCTS